MSSITDRLLSLKPNPSAEQKNALDKFLELGLPLYRSENYQRTDLSAMLDEAWEYGSAEYSDNRDEITLPEGAYLGNLKQSPIALKAIKSLAQDPIAQLVQGLNEEATLLYLPKGARIEKPYEVESFLMSNGRVLEARRVIIVLDEGASLEMLVKERNVGEHVSMSLQCLEIYLSKGAKLSYTDLEQTSELSRRISTLHLHQEEESDANINFFSLTNGKTRNNYYCDLAGEGANLQLGGFVVNSDKEHTDNFSFISHSVPHCTSTELFKYVLRDDSYGVFTGRILVAIDAQKTQAYQTNNNLLLSKTARMQAAKDEAKRLLSIAFSEDVLLHLDREELRDEVRELIAERFA